MRTLLAFFTLLIASTFSHANTFTINPNIFYLIDFDYYKECNTRRDERDAVHYGNLTLNSAADIEKYRCVKRVTGNLKLDLDNKIKVLVLPWLETVNGNLWLEAGAYFTKGKFPKLHTVDGDITLYNRNRSAHWWMPALIEHHSELEVVAGVQNDLTGFSNLEYVHKLYLRTHPNDIWGPFNFTGLDALTEAANLEYSLRSGQVSGSFLSNLTNVTNKVRLFIDDSGLFGLASIETIGGRLEIEETSYIYNLNHFSNIQSLGGLVLSDNAGLNNVSALSNVSMPTNGYIEITYNDNLNNCDAQDLVRALRNNQNWNTFSGSNTYVYSNGYSNCN